MKHLTKQELMGGLAQEVFLVLPAARTVQHNQITPRQPPTNFTLLSA